MAPPVAKLKVSTLAMPLVEEEAAAPQGWGSVEEALDRFFKISARQSTLATELRAGTTAFLASSNNFVVNAHIMVHAGVDPTTSVVSGAFASAVTCILSGVLSNLPLGLVPSVGPNVFLAFSLVAGGLYDLDASLAISGGCGFLLATLALSPALKITLALVPLSIKYGLIVGTGLLTALIGLKSIGVVVPDTGPQNDIVALGTIWSLEVFVATVSLVAIASLVHRGVKGAVLMGLLGATLLYWALSGDWPAQVVALRGLTLHPVRLSVLLEGHAWVQVFALLLMLVFSVSGALIGTARMAGLLREDGRVRGSTAVYVCCGLGTMVSAALGSAPIFVSMSAAAGVREGGRTGLVSVVFGLYALLTALVLSPLASAIPPCAVSPVLILVGVSMVGEAKEIHWWSMLDALPAFLCAVFQPFTYSVANGIYAGVGMSLVLFFTTGEFVQHVPSLQKCEEFPGAGPPAARSTSSLKEALEAGRPRQPEVRRGPSLMRAARASCAPPHALRLLRASSAGSLAETPRDREGSGRDDVRVRDRICDVGEAASREAIAVLQSAATFLGLDPDEVEALIEERLRAGRNAEAHFNGGIPGGESCAALAELAELEASEQTGAIDPNEAPALAAAWRRRGVSLVQRPRRTTVALE